MALRRDIVAALSSFFFLVFSCVCALGAAPRASAAPWANGREKRREEHKVALAD